MPTTLRPRRELLDLTLTLDRAMGSQARQMHAALRSAILAGQAAPGARLPSSRALAAQFGLPRHAVVTAYEWLQGDGLVETRLGDGAYVAALPARQASAVARSSAPPPPRRAPFALGKTWADPEILGRLARALRRRILTGGDLDYADALGPESLRRQIAEHSAREPRDRLRSTLRDDRARRPLCARLCAEALLQPGDSVWMEDPGYPAARRALEAAGAKVASAPVDAEGLDVAAAIASAPQARAVYVTPSHQFPTAVTMTMARRAALLAWARERDAYVFEDDYDSEFRYGGSPLTALAGLGGAKVVYLGTFSKTLFAGLRLAYLVAPPQAMAPLAATRATLDRFPPGPTSAAVADLMAEGALVAHTRRMRIRARAARDVVVSTLRASAGDALRIVAPAQGLHLVAYLPESASPGAADAILAEAGVEAVLISQMRLSGGGPDGFVLGFAGFETRDLAAAAERLGHAAAAAL